MSALDAAVQRLVDQAVEQGLPLYVEDETVIRRVASIIRTATDQERAA